MSIGATYPGERCNLGGGGISSGGDIPSAGIALESAAHSSSSTDARHKRISSRRCEDILAI